MGGDGRVEGSSAIGDGEQAGVSFMPDIDGTYSSSLLDSILPTLLKKGSSDIWVAFLALVFLTTDDWVALDCILNCCCSLPILLYIHILCLETNSASSNKENPLAIL